MPDDPRNDTESGGFDDWLSEAPGKVTDPYAESELDGQDSENDESQSSVDDPVLEEEAGDDTEPESSVDDPDLDEEASDDAESEHPVADDDETAEAVPDAEPPTPVGPEVDLNSDSDEDDDTDEDPVTSVDDERSEEQDDTDDTGEIPIVESVENEPADLAPEEFHAEPLVEFEAFDGGDEADTGELEIVAPAPFGEIDSGQQEATLVYDGAVESDSSVLPDESSDEDELQEDDTSEVPIVAWFPESTDEDVSQSDDFDPLEDTGEAVFVSGEGASIAAAAAGFGDLWDDDSVDDSSTNDSPQDDDVEEFTLGEGDLLLGATQEHVDLAAAIAAAENEDTEQVALVAEIPGLETSVVGFEDVVEAEGHRRVRARASGDLIARVITGIVLVLALGASLIWRPALVVFAIAVFVLGAGEFYTALVRTDRKPIALFGFIGIIGASVGAFFWSAVAIPMAFVLATILLLLFYAVVPGKSDPMGNLALTTTVMVWAGLGSFAMLIARSDDYQVLILGVVVAVAAADIAAFFVGRSLGRTHFAPWVSPKKTVEGLVAGIVVALGVGAMLHFFPPFELTSGLAIGAAAAFLTPVGDLAMSAAKRSLGLKDMGSVLPGHGGFLDRIDGLLFVIPVAWAVFIWAGLL